MTILAKSSRDTALKPIGAKIAVESTDILPRRRQLLLFLLGPRVIDFDTFLPTALELKRQHPAADIRFVTFSKANYDFIRANATLVAGLAECGTLHLLGSEGEVGVRRHVRRIGDLLRLCGWVLHSPAPALLSSRQFSELPYNLLYALARLRGGSGVLLWKSRSPDKVHQIVWQNRQPPTQRPRSLANRLLGREIDAVIYYHDEQIENVRMASAYGELDSVPWHAIGFPHLFPTWRSLIDTETARERKRLVAAGVPPDAELYAMFAAKAYSAVNLRSSDAIERVFHQLITTLCRLRPKAVVLIRPHPLAIDEPYIKAAIAAVGSDHARISLAHPEVLMALSRRALFNNPSNVIFSCFRANIIDCSDYADTHYQQEGEVSLAHGFGPLFINPRAPDFEARLAGLLDSDTSFSAPEAIAGRERLLRDNAPDLRPLAAVIRAPLAPELAT